MRWSIFRPHFAADGFELAHGKRAAFIPCLRAWCQQGRLDSGAAGFINPSRLKIGVQQNKQYAVPFLAEVDAAEALARTGAKHAAAFDLKTLHLAIFAANGVISSLTDCREFEIKQSRRLVLGDFAGDADRAPRQRPVPYGQLLRCDNQLAYFTISNVSWLCIPL